MDIEEDIYNKYRDTPYKFPDKSDQQEIGKEVNNHDNRKNDAYKELLDKIKKSVNDQPNSRYSDHITLNTTSDKMIRIKEQGSNSAINKNNNVSNYATTINSTYGDTSTILRQQPDKRKSVTYINNIYHSEMERQNTNNNDINSPNPFIINNSNVNDNKIVSNFNNYSSLDNYLNADKEEVENTEVKNYYNPFNKNNIHSSINNNNKSNDKTFKLPYITLTAIKNVPNEDKKGLFSGIINIFKKDKKNKSKNENSDGPQENYELEIENIDQKLRADPILNNNNDISDHQHDQNDYILSPNAQNNEETFGINNNVNNNKEEIEPNNNYGYNINGTTNDDENKDRTKNNYFVVQAEPIEDNNHRNIFDPSNIHDFHDNEQNSEYSLQTENNNYDDFFEKIKKLSPFLIVILLASAGLLFLIYKNAKIREFLINLLKNVSSFVPNLFKGLLSMFCSDMDDSMEIYDDNYRLLGAIICFIILFFMLRIFISFVAKKIKGKNEQSHY
jgi:hypothetical protein